MQFPSLKTNKYYTVEFDIELVKTFEWNKEAYENLVIPPDHKAVLTTLVEAHTSEPAAKIDDFVQGKGLGLVINLYGNPGTGELCVLSQFLCIYIFGCRKESYGRGHERT